MNKVGQKEFLTQKDVVQFFRNNLHYNYLGNWEYRDGNANVEKDILRAWLISQGQDEKIIGKVLQIKTIEPHQPARYYVLASAYDGDTSIDSGPYTKKSEAIFQANLISVTEAEALADGYSFMDFPDIVLSTKVVSHTECKQLDSKALSHYLVIRRANELAANLQNW